MKTITYIEAQRAVKNGTFSQLVPKETYRVAVKESTKMNIAIDWNDLPIKEYLIQRLEVACGSFVLLCATGCSGKTMFAQYIACCISEGKPLFNLFPVKKGSIIHIDQEQSQVQTLRRYKRLANGIGANTIDVSRITLKHRFDDPNLDLKEVEKELVDLCHDQALCIIDSLKAVSQADENSASIEVILKMFKRVSETTNCTIFLVHHKGKGKDAKQSGRGHSSIYDSVDVQIDLDCSNEVFELSCAKNREGRWFDGIKYQLLDSGNFMASQNCTTQLELNLLQDDVKSSRQSQKERIIVALTATPELKFNDLYGAVKGDRTKFNEVVTAMIEAKELTKTKGEKNSNLYSLISSEAF